MSKVKKEHWADPKTGYHTQEYRDRQSRDKKAWWDAHPEAKEALSQRIRLRAQRLREATK